MGTGVRKRLGAESLMRVMLSRFLFFGILCAALLSGKAGAQPPNALSAAEIKDGWRLLFNGKDVQGWEELSGSGWEVKEGELRALASVAPGQKDIVTKESFMYFELQFEFKLFEATNSGIKFWVDNDYSGNAGVWLGLEYQLLDNQGFSYPERGVFRQTAALYDLIPGHTGGKLPLDVWHSGCIRVTPQEIQYWLNGEKTLEFNPETDAFAALVLQSKYKDLKDFGKARNGRILLQNEGSAISFRNLKIRELH